MSSGASSISAVEAGPAPPVVERGRWPVVAVRGLALFSWTTLMTALLLISWLPALVWPGSSKALKAKSRRWIVRIWGQGMMGIIGVRITRHGKAPPRGVLVVSNHLSYLDMPVLGSLVPTVFVARADLRNWPFWGFVSTVGGTIFVDRATKRDVVRVRQDMRDAMTRGDSVVVFAEATSTSGETILPLKPALLADAASNAAPVHWLTLSYRTPPDGPAARDQVCWWGDTGFLPHVLGLLALRRVDCTVRFGDAPLKATDRKALAVELRREMLRHHEPVTGKKVRRDGE